MNGAADTDNRQSRSFGSAYPTNESVRGAPSRSAQDGTSKGMGRMKILFDAQDDALDGGAFFFAGAFLAGAFFAAGFFAGAAAGVPARKADHFRSRSFGASFVLAMARSATSLMIQSKLAWPTEWRSASGAGFMKSMA